VAALASGFQMHLAKPVNASDLVVTVATLVGRREWHDPRTQRADRTLWLCCVCVL